MKKRLLILGLGLAVVGTGMVINKLRKRNNEEVNEVEEISVDEEEPVIIDMDNVEVVNKEDIYVPNSDDNKTNKITEIIYTILINRLDKLKNKIHKHTMTVDDYYLCGNIEYKVKRFYHKLCLNIMKKESILLSAIALILCRKTIENK